MKTEFQLYACLLVLNLSCLGCPASTANVTVTRILSGNTVVTSEDTIVHIVGENQRNEVFVFTCAEPAAFDLATTLLLSNRVVVAYRGRQENGVTFGTIDVNGKSYLKELESRGLIKTRSPEAFAQKVVQIIEVPARWLRKPVTATARQPSILGEFFRGLADNLESQMLAGQTEFERDTNASLGDAVREYRRMADVYDTPWEAFGAEDMRNLWKSLDRLEQGVEEMHERNASEILRQLKLD